MADDILKKCFPTGSLIILVYMVERWLLILQQRFSTRFTNVLLGANFATDEIITVICASRFVAKYVVEAIRDGAFTAVRVGAVLAQIISGIRTCYKTPILQRVV